MNEARQLAGLAHGVALKAPVRAGEPVRWRDVEIDEAGDAAAFRREMEAVFKPQARAAE